MCIITLSFAMASQNELYEHYAAAAKSVDISIALYNIHARTGEALKTETVDKLSEISNIVGTKDSFDNFTNMLGYIK